MFTLFETHLKPDLTGTGESIGNFNETRVPRDVEVNIYRRICKNRVLQVHKGGFECLLNSDLFAIVVWSFPMIYIKHYYTVHTCKLQVFQYRSAEI